MKFYTENEIWEKFNKKRNKVDILFNALEFMQSSNGRSKVECIALGMGLELKED